MRKAVYAIRNKYTKVRYSYRLANKHEIMDMFENCFCEETDANAFEVYRTTQDVRQMAQDDLSGSLYLNY